MHLDAVENGDLRVSQLQGRAGVVGERARNVAAGLAAGGELDVPVRTFPLDRVRDAHGELEERHTRGKIVLVP